LLRAPTEAVAKVEIDAGWASAMTKVHGAKGADPIRKANAKRLCRTAAALFH